MATNDLGNGTLGTPGDTSGEGGSFSVAATSGETVVMPEGLNPATADFAHEGPDLVLTWDDGSEVVVTDYFMVDPQPTLASDQGAEVPGDLASRLAGPATPGMIAQAGADGVAEQPIGQIEKLDGTVTAVRADGTRVELQLGDPVYQGDILETGPDGAIGVILADETTFSMAEDGRMVLDEMIYDPGTQEGSVSMSVMQGVFTFVSGQVAKTDPDAMTLHTPVATIGIRGTQVGLDLSDGQNLDIVLMEEADGFVGEVVVSNGGGVTVLNGANEFTAVNSILSAPTASSLMDQQMMLNSFAGSLRYLPMNHSNVNDFGLQSSAQQGPNADGLADFETASGGAPETDIQAEGLADFDTTAGSETVEDELANFDVAAGASDQVGAVDDPIGVAEDAIAQILGAVGTGVGAGESTPQGGGTPDGTPPTPDGPRVDEPTETVPVADEAAEPTIAATNAEVQEDGSVALDITVTADGAGDTVESVTISGVPDGAKLSAGADNGDGTWTLSPAQLSGLTIKPEADYSGTFDLNVTATVVDGAATATTPTPVSLTVSVTPDADMPTLNVGDVTGVEDAGAIALNIASAVQDTDGSETLVVTIAGVPAGAQLSAGSFNATTGEWTVPGDSLAGLTVTPATDWNGTMNLSVTSTVTDAATGLASDTVSTDAVAMTVTVAPATDAVGISVVSGTGNEDGSVDMGVTVTPSGGETVTSVTVTGVPTGASLSLGTDNGDGSWTIDSAEDLAALGGLTFTAAGDWSGVTDPMTFAVTTNDGSANSVQAVATVTPDADMPTLNVGDVTGVEDAGAIALNIASAVQDTDGSETLVVTIAGVPAGAQLSAGSFNATTGEWTVPGDSLAGLTVTPATDWNGTMNLSVTSTVTDAATGLASDTVSTDAVAMTVTVAPATDAVGISVVSGTGNEDGSVDMGVTVTPSGGETVTSVTVTGVPTGASLSLGTDNGDGSWTIDSAEDLAALGGLTFTAAGDWSGVTDPMTFAVTTNDGSANSVQAVATVTPDADMPTLNVGDVTGVEDAGAIALNIASAVQDTDGSETLVVTIAGVPAGAQLSAGSFNATTGEWTVPGDSLAGLTVTPATDWNGTMNLSVTSTVTDAATGLASDTVSTDAVAMTVTVAPATDAVGISVVSGTGNEDGSVDMGVTVTPSGGETVTSVTVTGVPTGASLSLGTDNGDGSWTIDSAEDLAALGGLTFTAAGDWSGVTDPMTFAVTTNDGSANSVQAVATVTPDADMPTLNVGDVTGVEDAGAIALNIASAVQDTDGSETLVVTIAGVPAGAQLSAGSFNATTGEWTVPGDSLAGLTVTPATDWNGTMNLSVTSTVTDAATGLASDTVSTDAVAMTVTVAPATDAVGISVVSGTGNEDGSVDMGVTVTPSGGETVTSVTVTGVPTGASLSLGTDNGDGSWTIDSAEDLAALGGLTFTAAGDWSGVTDPMTFAVTTNDGSANSVQAVATVTPDADMPTLNVGDVTGVEDAGAIALNIASAVQDTDGSETLVVTIAGVPAGAQLSAGSFNATTGEWTVPGDSLAGLTVTPATDWNGTMNLSVTSTVTDAATGLASDTVSTDAVAMTVTVAPSTDAVGISVVSGTGNEDGSVDMGVTVTPSGGETVTSVTVTGVPTGASLSLGTDNGDGSWTIDSAEDLAALGGLTFTAAGDWSGVTDPMTFAVTTNDGSANSVQAVATVTPDADMPTLNVGDVTGVEDAGAIALNIASAVQDTDGSETLVVTIAGVPAGAQLSAGSFNATTGEWTVPGDSLAGLTVTPATDWNGTMNLSVTSTVTDAATGLASDTVSTDAVAMTVTVAPSTDAVGISVVSGTGNEDGSVDMGVTVTPSGGETVTSVTVTGVPTGASLSLGTDNGDGSWTIDSAEDLAALGGLTFTAAGDWSGVTDPMTFAVTTNDGSANSVQAVATVTPDADMPTLNVGDVTGVEDAGAIALNIASAVQDTDGSETLVVTIAGVPAGAQLSAGSFNATTGEWTVPGDSLAGLTVTPATDWNGTMNLSVTSTVTDAATGLASDTVSTDAVAMTVTVAPATDAVGISVVSGTGNEDGSVDMGVTVTPSGGETVTSVTVTGVPTGASLSLGTDNGDGSWTIDSAEDLAALGGLTFTAAGDWSGVTDPMTFAVTTNDGSANSVQAVATVTPDADMPTLNVGDVTGVEDAGAIALNIASAVQDTDGSETLVVTIAGVPAGAQLSAGSFNATTGEWTVPGDSLAGLTVTPATDWNGTMNLSVTSTVTDAATGLASDTVSTDAVAMTVTVAPATDAVGISVVSGTGNEDGSVDMGVTVTPSGGETVTSVTVTGVPTGASLSLGTDNGDGSWTIDSAEDLAALGGLTFTAAGDWSGVTDPMTFAVTTNDGSANSVQAVATVTPDADMPTLNVGDVTGVEDAGAIALNIASAVQDTDGSETLVVTIAGVPAGAQLSAGSFNATTGEWTVPGDSLAGLTVTPATDWNGTMNLSVTSTVTDAATGLASDTVSTDAVAMTVTVAPATDAVGISVVSGTGNEDGSVDMGVTVTPSGGETVTSVTVTGVPTGASLSLGTDNGDGSWTIDSAEDLAALGGLTFTAAGDWSGVTDPMTFAVTTNDGSANSVQAVATVTPDADMPTLNVGDVTGVEDAGAIALNIASAVQDTDGSETLVVTIAGVPAGAQLSAGSFNATTGEWTVPGDSLAGLTVTPATDWNGTMNLSVTSTVTDAATGLASDTVSTDAVAMTVTVAPSTDAVGISVVSGTGNEDGSVDMGVTVTPSGGETVTSVTVTGVPTGASLSLGTDNGDGSWTIDSAEDLAALGGLTFTAAGDWSGVTDPMTFAVTTNDGSANSVQAVATVTPDADMPTLNVGDVTGVEDAGAIALNIASAVQDTDGSETLVVTIAGVPAGAQLSAGSFNATTGEWTVPGDSLAGLTVTPATDWNGTMNLSVTSTVTDAATGLASDTVSTDAVAMTVTVAPSTDAVGISVVSGTGNEDGSVDMGVTVTPSGGETVTSVTVTGVPTGASLSLGTDNGDGSWTIDSAEDLAALGGLTFTAAGDWSGVTDPMTFAVTTNDGSANSVQAVATVTPDADMPTLNVGDVTGVEDAGAIALNIASAVQDTDGSETLVVTIAGVPAGAQLSAGSFNATTGEWTVPGDSLAGLTVTPATDWNGTMNLSVTSTVTDAATGLASDTVSTDAVAMTVTVAPATDAVGISVVSGTGNEDGSVDMGVTVTPSGGETVTSVTVTGVPTGASLSLGTDNGDGSWTIDSAEDLAALGGLTFTAAGDWSGVTDPMTFAVTTNDGSANSVQAVATVTPDADMPTLNVGDVTGVEDAGAIALNIASAVQDTDGSETLVVTIAGVPAGAQLSAGSFNATTGEWTVPGDSLAGLTVTPATDWNGTMNLSVTSTVTDAATGLASDTVSTDAVAMTVTVAPATDAVGISVVSGTGNEDGSVDMGVTVTPSGGETVTSVTVTGVPTGASLSLGTDNGDGSWTIDSAEDLAALGGLTFTAAGDWSGVTDPMTFAVTTNDGSANSVQAVATVTPDADMPTLNVGDVTGVEDAGAIALNIASAVQDTDGSETLVVTIAGVPAGAQLSAGSFNATTGEWTVPGDSLAGLTVTPATDWNGTMNLSVTSTVTDAATGLASDTATATQSLNVTVTPVGDAPGIAVVGGGTGDEDTNIPIGVTVTPVGGETLTNVVISGVPTGASLSLGADNGDGTWTIDGADLAELGSLTMTPDVNYSGAPLLSIAATTSEGGTATVDMPVTVVAVADAPTLTLSLGDPTVTEGGFLPDLDAMDHDISNIVMYLDDGTGNITKVKVEDFPGNGLDDVNDLGIEAFMDATYPGTTLVGLTVKAGDNHTPGFGPGEGELVYVAPGVTQTDLPVGDAASATYTYAQSLDGLPPSPIGGGEAGLSYPVDIATALTDTDGSEVLSLTVSGVPSGVTLSVGTDNGDGTWTVPTDQLSGLTMDVPAGTATFSLSVTSTSTEQSNLDAASVTQSVTVDGVSTTPDPTVDTVNVTGAEDGTVVLDITVSNADSVTITNIPDGGSLSVGADNGDGSWTLTPDQLTGLTFTPATDWSGSFDIGVTATATDGASATAVSTVDVTPVADAPTLSATTDGGAEDTAIALNIATAETDVDGSEVLSMTISGVPTGARLSAGTDNGDGTWTLNPATDLSGLTITPAANFNGTIDLVVTSTSTDTLGNVTDSASTTSNLSVTVTPVGDAPGIAVVGGGTGDEDTNIPIGVTVTPVGGETLTNVVISGVPTGASLSLGADNGDGTWTIDGADLAELGSLTMTPVEHYSGTPMLGVTATTSEGGTATADVPVTVVAVADAPTLDVTIGDPVVSDATGSLTLENMGQASAGYENTIGWYRMDENGEPVEGGVIWADAKESVGDSFTMDDVDPSTIGFFLLSDGGTQNPGLSNGESVTFAQDDSGTWQVLDAGGNPLDAASGGGLFFTNQTLNADGYDHESDSSSIGNMNWEDLNGGGDQDFNDVNLNLNTQAGSGDSTTSFDLNITSNLVDTDGSETLSLVVAGVPADATLSAGTDNGDGTWTLSPDQLSGLTVTVPGDVGTDFNLTVTATATEPNGDTASVSQTVTADMPDVVIPTVTMDANASGDEDTAIALDITVTNAASITIAGLPDGATLSVGTDNGDGTWTLTPDQLDGLTMTPDENYSGASDMTVTATSVSGYTASATSNVEVVAVADAPTLSVNLSEADASGTGAGETLASDDFNDGVSGWGGEVSSYNGQMNIDHNDTATKTFDFGAENAGKTVTISFDVANYGGWDESGAYQDHFTVSANGEQVLNTTDGDGSQSLTVTLDENGQLQLGMNVDATSCQEGLLIDNFAIVSGGDWVASDGAVFNLDITSSLIDTDGSETLSLMVDGVPADATLSAGTDNGDGTWSLTPDQLAGLQITVPGTVSDDFGLTVSATATEPNGDTATVSQTVTVDVPEAPSVDSVNATGNEDSTIALDITVSNADSVTISNVPTDATLSAGTDNGDGSWTLTPDQLTGLTFTPSDDWSGSFNVSVTATAADGASATTTSTVDVIAVADAPTLTTGVGDAVESRDVDYSDIAFGEGAGAGAGSDEKEVDLTKRDDFWVGDERDNDVDGEGGEDVLAGMGGADEIEGGSGNDLLFGGAGSDDLEGDSGNDIIFGGSGNNEIEGGYGNDFLIGGSGNDDIDGGKNDDVIFAGGGNDKVDGGSGTDVMVLSGAREDYLFTEMPGASGQYVIEHLNGGDDGVNLVENIETFQFTDGQFGLGDMMDSNPDDNLLLTYDITIDTGLADTDGSETLSDITVSGVPQGATFSAGTDNGDGSWTLGEDDLNGLTLQVDESVDQDFSLSVSVTSVESSNGDMATSTSTIDVALPDDVSVEGDTSVDALDPLAAMFEDSDTLSFEGEEYDISSLTDGDSKDDFGGVTPLGSGSSSSDDDGAGGDTSYQDDSSDGYSSSDSGSDDWNPDDNC